MSIKNSSLKFLLFIAIVCAITQLSESAIVSAPPPMLPEGSPPPSLLKIAALLGGSGIDQAALFSSPQYSGFLQLLSQIPNQVIDQFIKQLSSGVLQERFEGFNSTTNFSNWGETVSAVYQTILYPTDFSPLSGQQISSIQSFVKKAALQNKRVRGSGLRHSWSNIFPDSSQYLVSLYPSFLVEGTSQVLDVYAAKMAQLQTAMSALNVQHLNQIRKVGEICVLENEGKEMRNITKHLVKIGASVSNQQLKKWSLKNGYQLKSNAVISQISFVGALCTCSHGSGKDTQTLCDYVNEIQFIDSNGNRQTISKKEHPKLIKSAASSLGLLGIVIFVTVEMEDLQIVKMLPRISYKDFVIPWPKDYPIEKRQARMQRPQYKAWIHTQNLSNPNINQSWKDNFVKFTEALNHDFSHWLYFPNEKTQIFQNKWLNYLKNTPQNIQQIKSSDKQAIFIDQYPTRSMTSLSQFSLFLTNTLIRNEKTVMFANALLKNPFSFLPKSNFYLNKPDAMHFQRGVQNFIFRDFQCQINIPSIRIDGKLQPKYDLIQKIWWAAIQVVEKYSQTINISLQMKFFRASKATLAPSNGFDFVCSIQAIRSSVLNPIIQVAWKNSVSQLYKELRAITDSNGKRVTIRPHWAKEWDLSQQFKKDLFLDCQLKENLQAFLKDYKQITQLKQIPYKQNLFTFTNKFYRDLLNNAIQRKQDKIK